jgi:predicted RNA-binding protein associated with RNAse of E/G family
MGAGLACACAAKVRLPQLTTTHSRSSFRILHRIIAIQFHHRLGFKWFVSYGMAVILKRDLVGAEAG